MAHQDKRDAPIIGRDADPAKDEVSSRTTSESTDGNVNGTGDAEGGTDLDIVFVPEDIGDIRH